MAKLENKDKFGYVWYSRYIESETPKHHRRKAKRDPRRIPKRKW